MAPDATATMLHQMSDPRFKPRDFTDEPGSFGHSRTLVWHRSNDERTATRLRAAQIQHIFAVEIRKLIKAKFGRLARYAEATGQSEDRLGKMLRGDAIMRLEDLADAEHYLGMRVRPGSDDAM